MTEDKPKQILMLDDSALFLSIAKTALEAAGYRVQTAMDLEQLQQCRTLAEPDLILMDVNMPEVFGDDVAMVLRQVNKVEAPILLLSSLDPEELERRAADAEIEGYICKKAGIAAVIERVGKVFSPCQSQL